MIYHPFQWYFVREKKNPNLKHFISVQTRALFYSKRRLVVDDLM
jgi:hypothetical protein